MAAMPAQFTAGVFSRLVVWPTASYNTRRFSLATVEIVASTRRTYTRRHSQADLVRIARWFFFGTRQNAERGGSAGRIAIGQFWSRDWSAFCHFFQQFVYNNQQLQPNPNANPNTNANHIPNQWRMRQVKSGG